MTFQTFKDTPGRQAASILELDLDGCARSYGDAPCTADLSLVNKVIQSEDFSTSWTLSEATIVTNITGSTPLGSNIADRLVPQVASSSNKRVVQNFVIERDDNTISVYAMAEGYSVLSLKIFNGTDSVYASARFELADGVCKETVTTGLVSFGMVQVPGFPGWWRCRLSGLAPTPGLSNQLMIYSDGVAGLDSTGAWSADGTSGFLIVGAQARPGAFPGKYVKTTTATIDGGGTPDDLCFNTFGTCQDTPNYLKETRALKFIDTLQRPPSFLSYYPAIKSVKYAPTVIKPGGNLSIRGQVTVVLQDFATTDNEIDDYAELRTYDAENQGTFFGKMKARNKFYIGRPMRLLEGYLDAEDVADFRTREYIIDDISGPTANGQVIIKGKDVLSLAADVRAKAPTASTGTVASAVSIGGSSITVSTGDGPQYDPTTVDKHIRINDEIITVVSRSGDVLTVSGGRGAGGTTAAAHDVGDAIQACKTYEDEPVIDVIQNLLEDFANVPASFIPFTDWELEETESLAGYLMETIISEPTGVLSLLKEIAEITLLDIWYDDVDQEVKLKLQTPFTEVTETVTDTEDILKDSLKVKDLNSQRLSRVLIYYGIRNYAEKLKDSENYSLINFDIEADKEGVNKYNDERIKVIHSRWFDSTNATQVALTSTRLLDRFGITPKQIAFSLDAKDVERLKTGDVFDLESRVEQDTDGSNATNRYQVIETKAVKVASQYAYKADAFFQDPQPDTLTIATNQLDYDVFVELGGPPGPVDVTLTINAAVNVDGLTRAAIITAGMHPDSTLKIINNGNIRGLGGNGGNGGSVSGFYDFEPGLGCIGNSNGNDGGAGGVGGDAVDTDIDLTIDNTNGNIFGGAGAGGGGGADSTFSDFGGGGGGAGAIGTDTGNGGAGGVSSVTGNGPGCSVGNTNGVAGTAGSTSASGSLGAGGGFAGDGGAAGVDWGDDGSAGQSGPGQSGGSGGQGGFAVRLNGNAIVWLGGNTAAKVKGDVA